MPNDSSPTLRIVDILASGSPEHGLKDAVNAALSEKVGIVLDAFKQEIAGNYFGQSAPQLDEEIESLDEVTYSPAAKATKKVERRYQRIVDKKKARGEGGPYTDASKLAAKGDKEDQASYKSKMDAYWKERKRRGTYGPGAPADRTMDRRHATIERHTKARYDAKRKAAGTDHYGEDLQEISSDLMRKASYAAQEKGNKAAMASKKKSEDPEARARWKQSAKFSFAAKAKDDAKDFPASAKNNDIIAKAVPSFRKQMASVKKK